MDLFSMFFGGLAVWCFYNRAKAKALWEKGKALFTPKAPRE